MDHVSPEVPGRQRGACEAQLLRQPLATPASADARIRTRRLCPGRTMAWVRQNTGNEKSGKPGKAKKNWESNWAFDVNVRVMFFQCGLNQEIFVLSQERGRNSDSEHLSPSGDQPLGDPEANVVGEKSHFAWIF